jgi:tripartite-type tricarboxylate transporter receptor subunit TctC
VNGRKRSSRGPRLLAALLWIAFSAAAASAQTTVPLKIVVPFAAGGGIDTLARILQPKLSESLGRTIVIENRPGASTQVGTVSVARSAPDGSTVLFASEAHVVNHVFNTKRQYDAIKDFEPLSLLVRFPSVFYAHPSLKLATLREAIALIKSQPGKFNYGSMGPGTTGYLLFEYLKRRYGLDITYVPYQGAAPVVQALIAGDVQFAAVNYGTARGALEAGRVKPFVVTGPARLPQLPDVPTVAEEGYPDLDSYSWFAAFAPAGTPAPMVAQISGAMQAAVSAPDVRAKFAVQGWEGVGSSSEELDRWVRAELARWDKFVRESGVQLP